MIYHFGPDMVLRLRSLGCFAALEIWRTTQALDGPPVLFVDATTYDAFLAEMERTTPPSIEPDYLPPTIGTTHIRRLPAKGEGRLAGKP